MKLGFVLVALAVLSTSNIAEAQTPVPTGSLRAEAQSVIDAAGAQAFFVALDHPTMRRVRHTPSGMVCSFQPATNAAIQVFPGVGVPGEDVACVEQQGASEMAMFATKMSGASVDRWFESAERSMKNWGWRGGVQTLRAFHALDASPDDDSVRIRFDRRRGVYFGMLDDGVVIARLAVAGIGNDWYVKQRFRAAVGFPDPNSFGTSADQVDQLSEAVFASVLGQIVDPALVERINQQAFAHPTEAATPRAP